MNTNNLKILSFIFLLFVFVNSSVAQSGWLPLNSMTTEFLNAPFFTDANTGYVTGWNGTILKTTNAGVNWSSSQSLPTMEALRSVFFTDADTGYIASGSFGSFIGNVFKTTNGGDTWNGLTLPVHRHFYCVYFINSSTGFVTGNGGTILKTTDAGSTWSSLGIGGTSQIISIYFVDASNGFAAEGNGSITAGHILKTTDGGNNWQVTYTYAGAALCGVSFINANTGVAVAGGTGSAYGGIIRTTDGGNNWENLNYTTNQINLWSIRFISSSVGFITGASYGPTNGVILKTTNAGINWYPQLSNQSNFLSGSYFTNINTGYVTGYFGGLILKTTNGGGNFVGINPINNDVPAHFHVYQNYPNPFNPKTVIRYQLHASQGEALSNNILLKVYDALGNEVITLVNEKQNAGVYSVEFDASNYSSGVYFYTLEAGGYSETKRMILLK